MTSARPPEAIRAFSLIEVVFALGICSFALIAIIGLFTVGLKSSRESEEEIQAADLASLLISTRHALPTNEMSQFGIPSAALTNLYGNAYSNGGSLTSYVGIDGYLTNAASASYQISCRAGTNSVTGPHLAQVYLMLTWPPQADPTKAAAGRYELSTHIRLP